MSLDPAGIEIKRLAELREEVRADLRASAEFGVGASLGVGSRLSKLIDSLLARVADCYELLGEVYDSRRPDSAPGVHLDDLCGIVGVIREAATRSTVTLTLSGVASTIVPAGTRFRVPGGASFELLADAEIDLGGTVDADAQATATGPLEALAGAISVIVDAVTGLTGVTNAAAATPGRDTETDATLRARRERSLGVIGAGTDEAIAARIEALADVSGCFVHSNRSLLTDSYGVPGKGFWVVVWPDSGVDTARLAQAIWSLAPSGIWIHGSESETIVDSQGYNKVIRFDYATRVRVYCTITLETDSNFPDDGEDLVEAAVLEYAASLGVGDDFLPSRVQAALGEIEGIRSATVALGRSTPPASYTALAIEPFEIALLDSADLVIA